MSTKAIISRAKRKIKSIAGIPLNYIKGRRSVEYVLQNKKENEISIICTPLIGDTVYALSCLDALKTKNPEARIHVYSYQKFSNLLSEYRAIDAITFIDKPGNEMLQGLDQFLHFNGLCEWAKDRGVISANPFYYKKCYNADNPDCLYQMKTHIFEVGEQAPTTYHLVCNGRKEREKIAILNPYSYSTFEANFGVYEEITEALTALGYSVYTNVIKEQKTIKGSQELRCAIEELFKISCKAKVIVSARSGILDYLIASDINMFVVYENCSERLKKMYHLANWDRQGIIKEVYPGILGYSYQNVITDFRAFLRSIEEQI